MYPRLNDLEMHNSCRVLETMNKNGERLEGSEELKMPPVSTAVA